MEQWYIEEYIEHVEEEYYATVESRPTEDLVEWKLDEGKAYEWDHVVISQWPDTDHLRYCVGMGHHNKGHKVRAQEFARAKYSFDGLAFACPRCRKSLRKRSWRDLYTFESLRKVG